MSSCILPNGKTAHTLDQCSAFTYTETCQTCEEPALWHWNDDYADSESVVERKRLGCSACFETMLIVAAMAQQQ